MSDEIVETDEVIEPDNTLKKLMHNAFEKLNFPIENGKRYYIQWSEREVVEGTKIQTRANDEDFPTFMLDDNMRISISRSKVLGPVEE